jgi:hypothetical protein
MKYKTYLIQLTNLIKGIEKLQIQFVLNFLSGFILNVIHYKLIKIIIVMKI